MRTLASLSCSSLLLASLFVPLAQAQAQDALAQDPLVGLPQESFQVATLKFRIEGAEHNVTVQLFPEAAPRHVQNFIDNARSGLYRNLAVHRAIPGFIVQTGDPLTRAGGDRAGWGTGGNDNTIPAEIGLPHTRGAIAMARRHVGNPSKASNSAQFYFALDNLRNLDGDYTVFGQVLAGIDVLDRIGSTITDRADVPRQRIELVSVQVQETTNPSVIAAATRTRNSRSAISRNATPESEKTGFARFLERFW